LDNLQAIFTIAIGIGHESVVDDQVSRDRPSARHATPSPVNDKVSEVNRKFSNTQEIENPKIRFMIPENRGNDDRYGKSRYFTLAENFDDRAMPRLTRPAVSP
jgi:hypothetical protein